MRRITAAVILTVLILAVSFTGRIMTNNSISYIQSAMHDIDRHLSEGNTDAARQVCDAFLVEWEKHHDRLCMFLQHEHLDPLENILAVLPYYIEQGEIVLAQAECRTVQSITEHITRTEQITLENIL